MSNLIFIINILIVYFCLQTAFLVWCFIPIYNNGSIIIYTKFIRPYFLKHERDIDQIVNDLSKKGNNVYFIIHLVIDLHQLLVYSFMFFILCNFLNLISKIFCYCFKLIFLVDEI